MGQHVLVALRQAGWRIRLLVRGDPRLCLGDEAVELVPGTLDDERALRDLVSGSDAVVHMAGAIKARTREQFMEVNGKGTTAVATAWQTYAPDARFVMVSSLAAREPTLSHYAASKKQGERALEKLDGAACILRPCAIYGPGDRESLPLFKMSAWPFQPLLNGPDARLCFVHIHDVAAAIAVCAQRDAPDGVFELSDPRLAGYSWREVAEMVCDVAERRYRPVKLPQPVFKMLGIVGDMKAALMGTAEMLTSQKVSEALHPDWSSSKSRQLPATLWRPDYDLRSGFHQTLAWYRQAGWL